MQNSGRLSMSGNSLSVRVPPFSSQSSRRLSLCSQIATHSSPTVFPEKLTKKPKAFSNRTGAPIIDNQPDKSKREEHRIDIGSGDEKSDLLGYVVYSGKLILDKRKNVLNNNNPTDADQNSSSDIANQEAVAAKLTSKSLLWGSHVLPLDDVISVTYNVGVRHFTLHSYPLKKGVCGFSCFIKPKRSRNDFCFLASNVEEGVQWVGGFADLQCYVNCLPHPLVSSKKQTSSESRFLSE